MPEFQKRIEVLRRELEEGLGVVRLSGVPLAGLSDPEARVLFWALAVQLGTPVSQSAAGEKMFSVRDMGYAEGWRGMICLIGGGAP